MNPLVNIAIEAVRVAGRIITKASERLDLVTVHPKNHWDVVTNVDREVEQRISQVIHKAYPDHALIAEESGAKGQHDITWIIDPIDGTSNFIHNFPHYCTSIGIQVKGRLEHGVIYDPVRDELFVASVGKGAQLNGHKIRCRQQTTLEGAFLATSHFNDGLLPAAKQAMGLRRTGSAALDLAYVAAGRLDGFVAERLQIWDCAAGVVLIREAGGLISDFSGQENHLDNGQVVTANPKLFKHLLQSLHR